MSSTEITSQTPETTESAPEATRTFWRGDYRRTAQLLKSFRHVQYHTYTAKPASSQAIIDVMAAQMADLFAADAPEGSFDAEKFLAGTQLAPKPEFTPAYAGQPDYSQGDPDTEDDDL